MASTYEVGDQIPLTWAITVAGTPTNATVALTITLPDGTTSSPAVSNPSTGNYSANFTAMLNGQHTYRWVATGAVIAADSDVFRIGGLLSLAELKKQLNKTSTTDDAELQYYIDATTDAIESYCGRILQTSVTEVHCPFNETLVLRSERVASVQSLTEYVGTTAYTYTSISNPSQAGSYTYLLDPALTGVITRLGPGGFPMTFLGEVHVAYTAGMTVVPASVNLAARIIAQHLWRTQNGGAGLPALLDEPTSVLPGLGYAIPNRARELLDRYRKVGGIA